MKLLAISGSLRAVSSNTNVLLALQKLATPDIEIEIYDGVGALPHFNPDLDGDEPPDVVRALRHRIGECDGLIICSPEYAHGIAGAMKNLLDWLVSSLEFPEKPVALINTAQRAVHAQAQIREVLTTMSARLIDDASITVPLSGRSLDADSLVRDPELSAPLASALKAFTSAISATSGLST